MKNINYKEVVDELNENISQAHYENGYVFSHEYYYYEDIIKFNGIELYTSDNSVYLNNDDSEEENYVNTNEKLITYLIQTLNVKIAEMCYFGKDMEIALLKEKDYILLK